MKLHPRVTKTAVELVKRFEGLRRRAARLPDGSWTVGYGHTKSAREGAVVTPEEAELLLYYDLSEVATKVEAWTFTTLNQNQIEALTAFAFNIGLENFHRSTVLKRVNEGQHLQAAAAMELWRKSDVDGEGLVVDALVRRRAAEKAHYLTPPEGFRPSPTQVLRPAFDFSVIEAAAQSQVAQRAAVVDAPLDGDDPTASVEVAPEARPAPVSVTDFATRDAGAQVARQLQDVLAEAPPKDEAAQAEPLPVAVAESAPVQTLYAPEPAPTPHIEAPATVVAEAATLAGAAAVAAPFVFRGFEPPPSRFAPSTDAPPAPANEHSFEDGAAHAHPADPFTEVQAPAPEPFALSEASEPTYAPPTSAEPAPEATATPEPGQASGFSLFDRPLAPPSPRDMDIPTAQVRSGRLRDDEEMLDGPVPATRPSPIVNGHEPKPAGGLLQNRQVLFASIGILGIVLFFSAITTMLMGRATWTHLLIGFLGVLFITPAGVYFLLRRMGGAEPLHD